MSIMGGCQTKDYSLGIDEKAQHQSNYQLYMVNSKVITLSLLVALAVANLHHDRSRSFSIPNVTKVNVENERRIIAGNIYGELQVQTGSKKDNAKIINGSHSSRILFIELYEHNGKEYVVVDEDGVVTIWDGTFNKQLSTFALNATVYGATIRERQRGVDEPRLAINCGTWVFEFSLSTRQEIRTHEFNQTVLSILYTKASLFIATQTASVIVTADDGSVIKEIASPFGSISLMSLHNHNEWRSLTEEVIAVAAETSSTPYLLHIDLADGITSNTPLPNSTITSLNYCPGRLVEKERRRGIEDLIVLGIDGSSLQIRLEAYSKFWSIPEGIIDVACYEDELFVLKGNNQLQLRDLDHSEHNGSKLSAFAGVFFLVLILALIAYQLSKRKVAKREKSSQTPQEFELQEHMLQN